LAFAPLEGPTAATIRERHAELAGVDSMVWVENHGDTDAERVYTRSTAALKVARYLGGRWSLVLVGWLVPRILRDAVYDLIARHRHRLVRRIACEWIPLSERTRFLE
jgi:predicted DCC family thiol-disulfide oxidoreductase YuxK